MNQAVLDLSSIDGARSREVDFSAARKSTVGRILAEFGLAGYEPETLAAALAFFEGRNGHFLDIGANVGVFSWLMGAVYDDTVKVMPFEPFPPIADMADQVFLANGQAHRIVRKALSDKPGTAKFYISAKSDSSNSLNERFRAAKNVIDVEVTTLDDVCASFKADLIKIDTESTEPDVLAGGETYIAKNRPWVVVEVLAGRTEPKLNAFCEKFGYAPYPLTGNLPSQPQTIAGDKTYAQRDWLLAPEAPSADFRDKYQRWFDVLSSSGIARDRKRG